MSNITHLECALCGKQYEPGRVYNLCVCGAPLLVRYDLRRAAETMLRERMSSRPGTLWRYREVLPVTSDASIVCLGEGFTPLIHAQRLGERLGLPNLYLKDESLNPTGSFKARGLALAVSMAKELALRKLAIPSAGNAGGALAAYAGHGGLEAAVFMPADTPIINRQECALLGAKVVLVPGSIKDCAREMREQLKGGEWFDVSTLREPYRLE
jgi:threonine synthase